MKISIKDDEHQDVLLSIAVNALDLLQEKTGIEYIVIHEGDGTCLKTGVNEEDGLWVAKFTEDDDAVK